jgi:2-oxo-3-hexenedioate decarboxylase
MIDDCAARLEQAVRDRTAIGPLTVEHPDLTIDQAYEVQALNVARRVAAGERVMGAKLGLTSRAKQVQMGVDEPVYGQLLSGGIHASDDPVVLANYIHPRVEPEIVFVIGDELRGPGVTAGDVIAATRAVCCGLEIIDSRFADFKFTMTDVVADNTSAAGIVMGPTYVSPDALDLSLVGLLLEVDGQLVTTAAGAATMGHPADAVAMLANWLGGRGAAIEAGWVVYSGGLTNAVPLVPGTHVRATFGHLGSVGVRAI